MCLHFYTIREFSWQLSGSPVSIKPTFIPVDEIAALASKTVPAVESYAPTFAIPQLSSRSPLASGADGRRPGVPAGGGVGVGVGVGAGGGLGGGVGVDGGDGAGVPGTDRPQIRIGMPVICRGGTPHLPSQSDCCFSSIAVRE